MRHAPQRRVRGFTLLEMVFAITIGTMVMIAAGSLLIGMQRNERAITRRAEDAAALMRIRQVMQKSFNSVLMAPTPSGRTQPTAVAAPVALADTARAAPLDPAQQNAADRARSNKVLDDARATTPPRMVLERAGSSAMMSGVSAGGMAPQDITLPVGAGRMPLREMSGSSVLGLPGGLPQRLELVLMDAPVPTQQRDVFEVARAVRKMSEARLAKRRLAKEQAQAAGEAAGVATAVPVEESSDASGQDGEGQSEDELVGVRAVRGAFELRPQEPAPNAEADAPALFELWWVPSRLLRSVEEMREASRAMRLVEEAAVGDPFRVAQNIRALRWRMFDDRVKKDAYVGVFRQDLPAYVELDIEMASGVTAQWLFEVGLQTGNEASPPSSSTAGTGGATTGGTNAAGSSQQGAQLPPGSTNAVQPAMPQPKRAQPGRGKGDE